MALRNVMTHPDDDDVLRKKARPVKKVTLNVRLLLDDMAETMYSGNGVGLAANQVGLLRRLVVIDMGEELIKLINPVIIETSGEQLGLEGCLSVPDVWGTVKRPQTVVVSALNENGEEIKITGEGMLARALCHEIDHLDGILFLDKAEPGTIQNIAKREAD